MKGHGDIDRARSSIIEAVRQAAGGRVKIAVADVDGILRGKFVRTETLVASLDGGLGFDVFGYDLEDRPIDRVPHAGRRSGFADATLCLDLATYRIVPWDSNVPFILGNFVNKDGSPHALCPRQVLKSVLARAARMGFRATIGCEYEFFNFREDPKGWEERKGAPHPTPITHGMAGYSLFDANAHREYFNALWEDTARFGIPLESLHTETGPGVYEAAILHGEALETADRAILFKEAAKEIGARFGIIPSFMAKWHPKYPGCSGHIHQSLSDGDANVFHDKAGPHGGMSRVFRSYLAGQIDFLLDFGPMLWPTINSYKRLVNAFWAPVKPTWGVDNRTAAFRVLAGSPGSTRLETRFPGADMNPYLAIAAVVAAGLAGIERNAELRSGPITGENGGSEKIPEVPRTLIETTRIFRESETARDWLGDEFVDYFAATREWEWRQWLDAVTDWERKRYFEVI